MKKDLKKHNEECLGDWVDRLCEYIHVNKISEKELHEILHEVSVTSYASGSNSAIEIMRRR